MSRTPIALVSSNAPSLQARGSAGRTLAARLLGFGAFALLAGVFASGCGEDDGSDDAAPCGEMREGGSLKGDQKLMSCNGKYEFINQLDGNLVVYRSGTPLWSSNTDGGPVGTVTLQSGDLRLTSPGGTLLFNSKTSGHPGAIFRMQDDGNAVIYDASSAAVWATGTNEGGGSGGGSKGCSSNSDCHDKCKRCELSSGQCVSKLSC